ncbi:exosortase [Geomonas sp. RF6]|uniref:exosortase n=1 Tax=Geomonas sp. RF6 TaxID=2897342 RepID=UPI001E592E80|nr:exosortase [Geomonas sp. RF6]UFS68825.1 exosortase [Geomonas sp. RF6]
MQLKQSEAVQKGLATIGQLREIPLLTGVTYAAIIALFIPTFYKLFSFGWDNADYSHGPLILGAFFWLLWQRRDALKFRGSDEMNIFSFFTLLVGLACYAVGSMHGSMAIEAFSIVPVLLGATGFLFGKEGRKALLFPVIFLLFLVPPPLAFTDMLTAPLKMLVANASATLLKVAGYMVTKNGAVIIVNDYSIVVGDPCSGLRSLVALMAVGALYAQMQAGSALKKGALFLSVIPISIVANIVRLILLCLISVYLGEAAAEGFLHGFSGFLLFAVSVVCLVLTDAAMEWRPAHDRKK